MRVVADTSTIVSGLVWSGPSRHVLDAAREGRIQLFTSMSLLAELDDVLQRDKFAKPLARAGANPRRLLARFSALAQIVDVADVEPVVLHDPDDDAVIACAVAARADIIVSSDSHLLRLSTYRHIAIVTAIDLLARLSR